MLITLKFYQGFKYVQNVFTENINDTECCAKMGDYHHHEIRVNSFSCAHEVIENFQMSATAHWEKFRETLHDAEDDGFYDIRHEY
jgi:hypothetical protein